MKEPYVVSRQETGQAVEAPPATTNVADFTSGRQPSPRALSKWNSWEDYDGAY